MRKLYKAKDVPPDIGMATPRLAEINATCKEINDYYPCEIMYEFSQDTDNSYHFEGAVAVVISPQGLEITVNKDYNGIYNFFSQDLWYLEYVKYYNLKHKFKKPNNVKKLTRNKILAWVEYYERFYNHCKVVSDERIEKVKDFLAKVPDEFINSNYGKIFGCIETGNFEYQFEICKDYGHITQTIRYKGKHDIDTFLELVK